MPIQPPDPRRVAKAISVKFDRAAKVAEAVSELAKTRVMAGVPAAKGLRDPDKGDKAPINNAALMYIHEFGSPEANIPPRPVIYPAIRSIRKEIVEMMRKIGRAALEGKPIVVEKGFIALGLLAQKAMQQRISNGPFIPLKPGTIAARRARGRKGDKPLIDTGALRRALTYVIRRVS